MVDTATFDAFISAVDCIALEAIDVIRNGDCSEETQSKLEGAIPLYNACLHLEGLTKEMEALVHNNRGAARYYAGVAASKRLNAGGMDYDGHLFLESISDLVEAISCAPGMRLAKANQGAAYMALGQAFLAEETFKEALGMNGESIALDVLANMARERIGMGIHSMPYFAGSKIG